MTNVVKDEKNDDFMVGGISVSLQHNLIAKGELVCNLQPKAMAVLHYLATNRERVISNEELLVKVWQGRIVTNSSIQKCVNAIRVAFTQLDPTHEYIAYFSKQGYQLIAPEVQPPLPQIKSAKIWLTFITLAFMITPLYFIYIYYSPMVLGVHKTENVIQYSQVSPYVSSTGRETLIEPHPKSERVAFIRNTEPTTGSESNNQLFIHGAQGKDWQIATAREHFSLLAWSPSGRNLVAIDTHKDNQQPTQSLYSTFHIYTLNFKGNKIIEKNTLSHWRGHVNSVSWWDEGTIEFTVSQANKEANARYRYGIANQKLTQLNTTYPKGLLVSSHVFNKKTAIYTVSKESEMVHFLNEQQAITESKILPFKLASLSWSADGKGLFLLSKSNELFMLDTDAHVHKVQYTPEVIGQIKHVRSKNQGKDMVLTVSSALGDTTKLSFDFETNQTSNHSVQPFIERGGGLVYHSLELNF